MIVSFILMFAFSGCMLFYTAMMISNTYEQFTLPAFFMAGVITTIISGIVAVCQVNEEDD